ncbi:cytochrome P450 [Aspergillus mulundensis]|uniref:Putative Cytochrome P450 n=1 Tax=Aspergillus mulundensis TaxID=1810919 RepID=A0A3D8Q898_9EURO|nr:putative Cytochrome P450 [Aspergillus mulundensis]RDW57887.1 putative Cytochrome P450 [Aspergillus mulundensis]
MIPVISLLGVILYILFPATILYFINSLFLSAPLPQGVPFIREAPGKRSFSLKTRLAYLTDCESLFKEAYHKYLKHGNPVILPGFGVRNEVLLPPSSLRWASTQPDKVLSPGEAFVEIDQADYSIGNSRYISDAWHGLLVKTEMNAMLENIVASLNDELGVAFDKYFGTDTEQWQSIDLFEAVRMIVAQGASRFTVGLPLCRNEQYLKDSLDAIDGCVINAGVTGGCPPILRPLVGPLVGLKPRLANRRVRKHVEPLYHARMKSLSKPIEEQPTDHFQMMLRFAARERQFELHDLNTMATRVTAANFGSMHQTSIAVTNMLLNILASDSEYNTIAVLRDEIEQTLGSDPAWTKSSISKMLKADSVARETLRCHSFGGRSFFRKVLVVGVVTDTGLSLPKGTLFCFLSQQPHMDEQVYPDARKYDPFRFSRAREAASDPNSSKTSSPSLSFVSTGPNYLGFGHGKHACPGRFLVDFELKMVMAYVLTHYEIRFPEEYKGERPRNRWMAEAVVPPEGVRVLVKRRKL